MQSNTYGAYTLFKKEVNRFKTVWVQTIVSPLISNLLFLAIFGLSLNRSMPELDGGVTYLQFLVPGLVIMGMMNNAFQNSSSSIIIAKYNDTISDLLTIPLRPIEIQYAYTLAAVARGLVVGVVTYLSTLPFVQVPIKNLPLILLTSVLINVAFGLLGLMVGIWSKEFDKISAIQNFILTPFIYLGGVFYSISILPDLFQKISSLNPFAYMIDLLRAAFIGTSTFPISTSLVIVIATTVVLHVITGWMLRTGYRIQS
jgi:ABC-2 type transport system permease protein